VKHVDEYRDPAAVRALADGIARLATRPWTIMEVCGGQTHAIMKFGLDELLPETVTLVHGPGCPVCVTPIEVLDRAIAIARRPEVILCTYGDMLRVPGSHLDLQRVKATVDAVRLARENPDRQVVFLAVGFETTAPAHAMAAALARREKLPNFSLIISHVLVPPAIEAILSSPECRVQGFLAAGHVCAVMGFTEYEPLARRHHVPIVVTGFEPVDILEGVRRCVHQLQDGRAEVENAYPRVVRREGNLPAQALMREVFTVVPRKWRGIGEIPASGLELSAAYAELDAERRFGVLAITADESSECISGLVLQGRKKPNECPAFVARCTPEHPLGATMVSSEGACAAYYRYGRRERLAKGGRHA
jgi:hydrogenase expression/formation protein HypD